MIARAVCAWYSFNWHLALLGWSLSILGFTGLQFYLFLFLFFLLVSRASMQFLLDLQITQFPVVKFGIFLFLVA